jgi:hypothetical protein
VVLRRKLLHEHRRDADMVWDPGGEPQLLEHINHFDDVTGLPSNGRRISYVLVLGDA